MTLVSIIGIYREGISFTTPPHSVKPLNPNSDEHLVSSNNITCESHSKVMRIKDMVTMEGTLWLANKFSLSAPQELYKEQSGEYAYWC